MVKYIPYDESKIDFHEIGPANLENGQRQYVNLVDQRIIVFNLAGEYYAIDNTCSHDGWSLDEGEIGDHQVVCPRHHARFDVRTGEVLENPPDAQIEAIGTYPVKIEKGIIYIGISR
ncbi:MAG: Rieske 2Fe-2S domain-containing protein [Anaerolineales bacterium]|nr:Rieske 2Fe-2S domain-containing protein [Anaerolineales bacterium]